jgi:dTDP-4-dehydrorhamnose reductase
VRVWLSGGSGFVGSNVARVLVERHGVELCRPSHEEVDLTDAAAVRRSVAAFRPDAIVHAAILNDLGALARRRRAAWEAYVGATRNVVDGAGDAQVVLISTDWVFDGTQAPAAEDEPPNPINLYGFLKAASELVVSERAVRGAVARIAGVQGVHWARPAAPRSQDAGFGYFVAALVESLRAGRRFAVWEGPRINMRATPTLASDAAELIWRILAQGLTGTFHCCGGEHADRMGLARRAVEEFELDAELLDSAAPPEPEAPVPHDTRLDASATATALAVELPDLTTQLRRLRLEIDTGRLA